MEKVYCDTNVYIDALGLGKPAKVKYGNFSDFAWIFLDRVMNGECILVTSSWVFDEFKKVIGNDKKLTELLEGIENSNKIHIQENQNHKNEARELSKNNFADARHVILAKHSGAMIITTQNIKDFVEFEEYLKEHGIELLKPQNV
ncbi:MAG: type II toxin-antitoxin system VapC family toxin [Candidatus Woesearchaeota archaeon]